MVNQIKYYNLIHSIKFFSSTQNILILFLAMYNSHLKKTVTSNVKHKFCSWNKRQRRGCEWSRKNEKQSIVIRQALLLKGGETPLQKSWSKIMNARSWRMDTCYKEHNNCCRLSILLWAEMNVNVHRSKTNSSMNVFEFASYHFHKKWIKIEKKQ